MNQTAAIHPAFERAYLFPPTLTEKYKKNKEDKDVQMDVQMELFKHMTNFACRKHFGNPKLERKPYVPSAYLMVEITEDQVDFLNPSIQDVLLASVEEEAYGAHAKKKRARRRHDLVDGNIKSYARLLNSEERLNKFQEYQGLNAIISEMRREEDEKRDARKEEKRQKEAEKRRSKEEREAQEKARKEQLLPGIDEDIGKGVDHIKSLHVLHLKDIYVYACGANRTDVNKLRKPALVAAICAAKGLTMDNETTET